jgi:hypothetical protein
VFAKVVATNIYGSSVESNLGGGGTIVRVPDAVLDLEEVYADRTPTTLGMKWLDGPENGGLTVQDYQVNIAELGGEFSVFETGVTI